jgi:hypothetical protein
MLANDTDADGGRRRSSRLPTGERGVIITGGGAGPTPQANFVALTPSIYALAGWQHGDRFVRSRVDDPQPSTTRPPPTGRGASHHDVPANDTDPDGGPKEVTGASDPERCGGRGRRRPQPDVRTRLQR